MASRWLSGLQQTAQALWAPLTSRKTGTADRPDAEMLEQLEATLLKADVGLPTTQALLSELSQANLDWQHPDQLKNWLRQALLAKVTLPSSSERTPTMPRLEAGQMLILLIVGVNGSGKTTLIGKLAHYYQQLGLRVRIGAGDTFRAAADEQLAVWAQRTGASLVRLQPGSDPSAVVYQTLTQARDNGDQVVLLDTAGRLQNHTNLMAQLAKLRRILDRERPETSIVESLLVLDATTGQNGLQQARLFEETVGLSGVVLTKLDGSAKGGVVLPIVQEYGLPVKLVGLGEGVDDLAPFDPDAYVDGLLGSAF